MKTNNYQTAGLNQSIQISFMTVLFLMFVFGTVSSQTTDKVVKGIVTMADDGSALAGAHIQLKGTQYGTVTDAAGKFEFLRTVKPNDILIFSFIGLKTQEITVTEATPEVLQIVMEFEEISMVGEFFGSVYEPKQNAFARIRIKLRSMF